MSEYFPKPKSLGSYITVELDLTIMQQRQICKMRQVLVH